MILCNKEGTEISPCEDRIMVKRFGWELQSEHIKLQAKMTEGEWREYTSGAQAFVNTAELDVFY